MTDLKARMRYLRFKERHRVEKAAKQVEKYFNHLEANKIDGEEWRPLPVPELAEYYSVSNKGRIKSSGVRMNDKNGNPWVKLPRILKARIQKGYHKANLNLNGKKVYYQVHQLVARAFIPNAENKPFINHKDGNPSNNNVENLEWCTQNENMEHSYYVLGKGNLENIPVIQYTLDWQYVNEFLSLSKAAKSLGGNSASIKCALINENRSAYGFRWKRK